MPPHKEPLHVLNRVSNFPRFVALVALIVTVGTVSAYADEASPTLRGATSAATASDAASIAVPRPPDLRAGDVMVAAVTARLGEDDWINRPAGWSPIRRDTCFGPKQTAADSGPLPQGRIGLRARLVRLVVPVGDGRDRPGRGVRQCRAEQHGRGQLRPADAKLGGLRCLFGDSRCAGVAPRRSVRHE